MRKSLFDLITNTILYQYDLPNAEKRISRTEFSTENDKCYLANNIEAIKEVIYNSIVEYSYNEFELKDKDYQSLHAAALKTRLKYNNLANDATKLKYGFFGEVLLYSVLTVLFNAKPLIARGYFFNPLEKAETKGYDSYQLIQNGDKTELWFGEVKFHGNYNSAIKSVMENIEKALSDIYFDTNVLALYNHKNNFDIKGSKIETILEAWEADPSIVISEEIKKYDMKLIYPVLLLYEQDDTGYENNIKLAVEHIQSEYPKKAFSITIDHSVFFIFLPLEKVKEIKKDVIEWIESKKQLMS
jgi:hypothetical protein